MVFLERLVVDRDLDPLVLLVELRLPVFLAGEGLVFGRATSGVALGGNSLSEVLL